MTVTGIYQKYTIPPNLQKHQLRVAYVAHTIAINQQKQAINPDEIMEAGLFHDMGNLIKYKFDDPAMLEGEDVQYWQQAQQQFIRQYGSHVHQATLAICQDIGLSKSVIDTIKIAEWDDTPALLKDNKTAACILIYADMRVGPYSILSYRDRIDNVQQRSPSEHFRQRLEYAQILEKSLQSHTGISLPDIDETGFTEFSHWAVDYQIDPVSV
jgi:hypothetical protein